MTKQEALTIIDEENLRGYNFEGKEIRSDEVGIQFENQKWKVYSTDERANYQLIGEYDVEGDAIAHVIECLRINKRLEERRNRKKNTMGSR